MEIKDKDSPYPGVITGKEKEGYFGEFVFIYCFSIEF